MNKGLFFLQNSIFDINYPDLREIHAKMREEPDPSVHIHIASKINFNKQEPQV